MPLVPRRLALAGLGAASLAFSAPVQALAEAPASGEARFDAVRRAVLQTLEEAQVPSIAVAIVENGDIVWEEAFGWADKERQIPATAHTAYSLASMTKPITATAVMKLNQAGQLDIDAPIERYLGGVRLTDDFGTADAVTARRIMSHSAGLPQYGNFHLDGSTPAGSAETISKFGMTVFPPNTRFEYSNIGMKILDAAVEEVSGQTFGAFLQREIFRPLGMNDSAVGLPAGVEAAIRYDNNRNPMPFYLTDHPGSGDVWASAHDMGRFLAFHMGVRLAGQQPILSDDTRQEMQTPASDFPMPTPAGSPRRDLGANWILSTSNGHPQVWHSGGQPGVSTFMAFYPEQHLGFVLLANSSAPLGRIGQAIRETLAPELVEAQAASPSTAAEPIPFHGVWEGVVTNYRAATPLRLTFQDGGGIVVQLDDQPATELTRAAFENGALTGGFSGTSNLPEAQRAEHALALKVVLVEGELVGQLVAQGMSETAVFMLPSFVRLRPAPNGS